MSRLRQPAPGDAPGPSRILTGLPGSGWLRWEPGQPVPATEGIYVAVFKLACARQVHVGALGPRALGPGWYLYVGSAQRNLPARVRRHARREKSRRWHIDHLAAVTRLVEAWILPEAERLWECRVAAALTARHGVMVQGFGASDCACATHLFHVRAG